MSSQPWEKWLQRIDACSTFDVSPREERNAKRGFKCFMCLLLLVLLLILWHGLKVSPGCKWGVNGSLPPEKKTQQQHRIKIQKWNNQKAISCEQSNNRKIISVSSSFPNSHIWYILTFSIDVYSIFFWRCIVLVLLLKCRNGVVFFFSLSTHSVKCKAQHVLFVKVFCFCFFLLFFVCLSSSIFSTKFEGWRQMRLLFKSTRRKKQNY